MYSQDMQPGKCKSFDVRKNGLIYFSEHQVTLIIAFLTHDIVRFRYATDGQFEEDFTYGVTQRFIPENPHINISETEDLIRLASDSLVVNIQKVDSKIVISEHSGKIICRDEKGFHWEEHPKYGGNIVKMSKVIQEGEHYYGMGDKTTHPNLRGKRVVNWAMDTYGFKKEEDPIYKAIPFYSAIHSGLGYGLFFDNTFKSYFDFGSERRNVTSFWAEGGEMNYYFIYGPHLEDVTRRYTRLTGVPELPPLWALGYHQCKWSYYPESKVRDVAMKFRKHRIPCDVIYLDIDYMDGFRCFTWDKEKFPDPQAMISSLEDQGFKTVVIIDPGIKIDDQYEVFNEALENNYFCKRADGPYMKGNVWPGECYFPDFTHPKVRKWWAGLFEDLIQNKGVRGVWNDMNEPALFEIEGKTFPDDVRHDYDGHPCSHRKAHNIYGTQMARATYKGVRKYLNGKRPLVITRSAYAGAQRYASAWTGDNIASWEHLWIANMQCQRMAVSGFSFVGTDIGGFIDHPTPELYARWIQLGVFHPFCRTHSSGDHGEQEPWSFGEEVLGIARKFIELRYQWLPYFYTAFYKYVHEYTPVLKPISMYDQTDHDTLYRADEFILGDHVLVCPVLEPNARSRYVYLPKGKWYHYWTDTLSEGGKEIHQDCPLDQIPLYVRAGAVIPAFPVMQHTGERAIGQLTLHVYFGGDKTESHLYEDSGDGYDYEKGIYNLKQFVVSSDYRTLRMTMKRRGHYETDYDTYKIVIHGLPSDVEKVMINDKSVELQNLVYENKKLVVITDKNTFLSIDVVCSG